MEGRGDGGGEREREREKETQQKRKKNHPLSGTKREVKILNHHLSITFMQPWRCG